MEEIRDLAVMHSDQINVPEEIQEAIRSLIRWAGDDPDREGLIDSPKRVAKAWKYYCRGYQENPEIHLKTVFEEVGGYEDVVLLKGIPFYSHCEHHMAPIMGHAHIAYLPDKKVVGLSKLARVLKGYANRLQIQERLTAQVADCIWNNLNPRGVAVVISATHSCMAARGVETANVLTVTKTMRGIYRDDPEQAKMILNLMGV
ncbi:MAG: GTP cyclohydrolase I FolE [Zymomonas mobilis]|uniref:GTP cyclohydrolase 1 n=1 Tax=Zymomonas mobilis TaxID=542 RepID=A0A542W1Z7_ZYMMB|nr:GTP cyclohydrolase I FolE [Zymomonas mobilis]TQL17600.1 GTP cyclohydrolase I [Zymomonas mobilis]